MTNKFDRTKPVQTRTGRKATIMSHMLEGEAYSLIVVVETSLGVERVFQYDCLGQRKPYRGRPCSAAAQLVDVPEEVVICELQEQNKLLLDALKTVVTIAEETRKSWDADEDMRVGKILIALAGKNDGYRSDIDWIHELIKQCEES